MPIIHKQAIKVKSLLELPLCIPKYQRPYKWQARHVNQLLDDLIRHQNKSSYRLGTVVLHQDNKTDASSKQFQIVDGQQRLLTLTLISHLLAQELDNQDACRSTLLKSHFTSTITISNLRHNASIVKSRLQQLNASARTELADFLLHKCELIQVVLDDISEAFQFFDSQNARGKTLAPHDLLKAFHLREMGSNTEQERTACVERWENSIDPESHSASALHIIMGDVLFRIRRWTEGESAKKFSRHHIAVFKGISLHNDNYPFADPLRALDYMVDQYNSDAIRSWDQQQMTYPFRIDQTLLNGKRFFEYIYHYTSLYQTVLQHDRKELQDILPILNSYEGHHRTGDQYVRNLFNTVLLYYYDRFGAAELPKAAQKCFLWSYRIRLLQSRVVIESVDNAAMSNDGLFAVIKRALYPQEVLTYLVQPILATDIKSSKTDALITAFNKMGGVQS